jgi:hypothetical protein
MRALISLAAARSWGGWLEKQDDAVGSAELGGRA